ncbi:hypothetical protein P4237_07440 [Pseudomonas aeruginosa]|nr:hypothetical protein [Pseudomonas aeruginosa]
MKIDSASSSPSLAQRQLMTRTPDQDFQRDFQAAYARLAVAAEGSAEQAGALADTLGATQLEYSRVRGVSLEDQLRFAHVLNRACENGAQLDARGFLARLGADDLQALQRNMGLAEPIRVEALSEEGARNLLLPEGYSVDLDGDGITEVGAAKIRHFPRATHRRPSSTSGWRSPPAWTAPPIRTPATGCNGLRYPRHGRPAPGHRPVGQLPHGGGRLPGHARRAPPRPGSRPVRTRPAAVPGAAPAPGLRSPTL